MKDEDWDKPKKFSWFSKKPSKEEEKEDEFCCPDVDVIDSDDETIIKIDLPGIRKEDIELNLNSNSVEVTADKQEEEGEEYCYCLQERPAGAGFYRKLALPEEIIPEEAIAKFRHGTLVIHAPKAEESESDIISVEIE